MKIPQYLDSLSGKYYEQLKLYIESPADLLENTEIGVGIYYRLEAIWPRMLAFNMLYLLQAVIVTSHLVIKSEDARDG